MKSLFILLLPLMFVAFPVFAQEPESEGDGGFEELYNLYTENKDTKNMEIPQMLLEFAPQYVPMLDSYERQKWTVRIEKLFDHYIKYKGLEKMMNERDFKIITTYHNKMTKKDAIFDFFVKNFDRATDSIKAEDLSAYLIQMYNSQIIGACKSGTLEYKKYIARLDKDLKPIYATVKFGKLSTVEAVTLLADASYELYRNNDDRYIELMNRYFDGAREVLSVNQITHPIMELYAQHDGNISAKTQVKIIPWIDMALKFEMMPAVRCRLLIILGDCFQSSGDITRAKQSYNQAFMASPNIENPQEMKGLQEVIQQKVNGL